MEPVEARADPKHGLLVIDIRQRSRRPSDGADMSDIAHTEIHQALDHATLHVRVETLECDAQRIAVVRGNLRQIECFPRTVEYERIFVGLDADLHGIDDLVSCPEDFFDIAHEVRGVSNGIIDIAMEALAATLCCASRPVIGHENNGVLAGCHRSHDPVEQEFAEMTADIELASEIPERPDDPDREAGDEGQVNTPVHAFHGRDCDRVFCPVLSATQGLVWAGELRALVSVVCQKVCDDFVASGFHCGSLLGWLVRFLKVQVQPQILVRHKKEKTATRRYRNLQFDGFETTRAGLPAQMRL